MMNSKESKGSEEDFDINRAKLKKVFIQLLPDKEARITFSELVKFCKLTKVFPVSLTKDLVSMAELKKLVGRSESPPKICFSQFLSTLNLIAVNFFTDSNSRGRVRQFMRHIANPCKTEYGVTLVIQYDDNSDLELKSSLFRPRSAVDLAKRRGSSSVKVGSAIPSGFIALRSPRVVEGKSPSGHSGRASPSEGPPTHRTPNSRKKKLVLREDITSSRRVLSQPVTSRSTSKSFKLNPKVLKLLEEKFHHSSFKEAEGTLRREGSKTSRNPLSSTSRSTKRIPTRPPLVPPLGILTVSSIENLPGQRQTPSKSHTSTEALLFKIKSTFEAFKSTHFALVNKPKTSTKVRASRQETLK